MAEPRELSEVSERYAAGLARREALEASEPEETGARRGRLHQALKEAGVRGWPDNTTYYTRELPPGCAPCLAGAGSNVCVTTRCTRDCFFCFNPRPRADVLSVHGRKVASEAEAASLLKDLGARSVGLSGGEPLLLPERTEALLRALRSGLGPSVRIDLYSNGDLLTPALARRLRAAGLDGVRLNLVANGFNAAPAREALAAGLGVDVEIPVVPGQEGRLEDLVLELDEAGVPHLILHELFSCAQNFDELKRLGFRGASGDAGSALMWAPVAGSAEAAMEVLLFAAKRARRLSAYFCSCATQEWIARNALQREASRNG